MSRTTSFREFLKSAKLGPLVPGMTLRDVAEELGPPDWFQFHPDTKLVPDSWGYGSVGKVAIFFRVDTSFIADGNAEDYLEKMPVRQLIQAVNPRTELDSIYALKDAREAFLAASAVTSRRIEGKHYLAAMEH